MDVDVNNLSDAELRNKLLEFGFPLMPITGTTRKILTKKLKIWMENAGKIDGKEGRRSLGRYSSEEESDSDTVTTRRRATMAPPPSPSRKKPPTPIRPQENLEEKTTISTRTMKLVESARNDYDTGSESDEVAEKYVEKKASTPNRLPSSFVSASLAANAASDRLNQIRSRNLYSTPDDLLKERENTPFLSNFTKRLSQLSAADSPKSHYDYKNDIIKENDGSGSSRTYLNNFRSTRNRPTSDPSKWTNQSNLFKDNFIPFLVLIIALLFFITVAVVYLGIRSDTSIDMAATVPICDKKNPASRRYVNCILEHERKPTFNLLQVLKPELQKRALRNLCDDYHSKPYMTENDIIRFVVMNYTIKNETRISEDLANLEVLSFFNPRWDIKLLLLSEDGVNYSHSSIAIDMETVVRERHLKVTALIIQQPNVPWKCYCYNTFWSFFSLSLSIIGGALILYIFNYSYQYYKQLRQKQLEEELTIVESIIDILQTNAVDNDVNYMVINHVRDMLLPITERKRKQKIWNRAVKYIQENESRIRVEEKDVQGEVSEVWRWLGGNLNISKNKSWQGQAFETQQGSVNSLPCSPTQCLKIRGMVEEGDRNTLAIRKAVLTKCAQQCRILHCGVDITSKCVYIKCVDQNDAAIAYRNLHGWWYAGNLVTVKYLRLERYMQRFPDSPANGPPFLVA